MVIYQSLCFLTLLQVWEALVTLFFFPVCVLLAWIADRRLLFYKYLYKRYRADKRHGIIVETEGGLAPKGIDVIMEGKFHEINPSNSTSNSTSTIISMENSKEEEPNREEVRKKEEEQVNKLFSHILNVAKR